MATKLTCDFCDAELGSGTSKYSVLVSDVTKEKDLLERDACGSCIEIVRRLLMRPIGQLNEALERMLHR